MDTSKPTFDNPAGQACAVCGEAVACHPGAGRPRKHCSKKCAWTAKLRRDNPFVEVTCVGCGMKFMGTAKRKYHSLECMKRGRIKKPCAGGCGKEVSRRGRSGPVAWCDGCAARTRSRAQAQTLACETLECRNCGSLFTPHTARHRFCSVICQHRWWCDRKRARRKTAFVEGVSLDYLFERDGGVCQICNEEVDRSYSGIHPRAPAIDHIISLDRGGLHERKNVQLAHYGCNSKKHTKTGYQRRLFG